MSKYVIKDCCDRKSFASQEDARSFCNWMAENDIGCGVPYLCKTCDRWHFTANREASIKARARSKRQRCVTDRELHLQMARVMGISLEELQTRVDLSKIKLAQGPGIEIVKLRDKPNQPK